MAHRLTGLARPAVFFDSNGDTQSRIADQQRRVGLLQHFRQIRKRFKKLGRDAPFFRAQNTRQNLRAAGATVQRKRLHLLDRLLGKARAQDDIGAAFLAVAFKRIARDRGSEEQEIVEMREPALGAGSANVVDAGRRRPPDFG